MYPHYFYIQLHLINPLTATSKKCLYRHIGCKHMCFLFYQQDVWHNATSWLTAYESLKLCTYLQLFSPINALPYANGGIMAQHSVLVGWNTMDQSPKWRDVSLYITSISFLEQARQWGACGFDHIVVGWSVSRKWRSLIWRRDSLLSALSGVSKSVKRKLTATSCWKVGNVEGPPLFWYKMLLFINQNVAIRQHNVK